MYIKRLYYTYIQGRPRIGHVNILYTQNNQGGVLPIIIKNKNNKNFNIKIIGNNGFYMKESVFTSYYCISNIIKEKDILYNPLSFTIKPNIDFIYHNPFIDGSCAGCGIAVGMFSRILDKKIPSDIAITGSLQPTGKIIGIGSLELKLIGAKKEKIKRVYIPKENEEEFITIKNNYKYLINKNFQVIAVSDIRELISSVFNMTLKF